MAEEEALSLKTRAKQKPMTQPLVAPDPEESKSGCLFCPLLPFSRDFDLYEEQYGRDAKKILAKQKGDHSVNTRYVGETPWKQVDVLFVGEAPGKDEDKKGRPFVGRSGYILREAIKDPDILGLKPSQYAVSNVVRCRPPRNRDPNRTEIKSCSYELVREIQARKPKLVVCLGNYSLEYLTGQTGITTLQGKFLHCTRPEFPDLMVLACLHPAYVLRFDHLLQKFCDALELVKTYLAGEYAPLPGKGEYRVLDEADDVVALMEAFKEDGLTVAFDTECGSLSPFQEEFPSLLCFSFANEEGLAFTVPYDHAESPWNDAGDKKARGKVTEALQAFFSDAEIPKIAQNGKFDMQHIRHALGVHVAGYARDTMTTHLVLDERRGTHGLKSLAWQYTGMGGYEKPLEDYTARHRDANPDKGGSYANIPAKLLFPYAAMDADVTLRVDVAMRQCPEYKKNKKFQRLSECFLPRMSEVLSDMEYEGAQIDQEVAAELDEFYQDEMVKYATKIADEPLVKKFVADQENKGKPLKGGVFNPGSVQQLQKVLFGYYESTPVELTDAGLDRLRERWMNEREKRAKKNLPSLNFDAIMLQAIQNKEWDLFSTKADVLHELERSGNPLAPLIIAYREPETLHGTFVKPMMLQLDQWGRLHGTYHPTGTATGRLCVDGDTLLETSAGSVKIKDLDLTKYAECSIRTHRGRLRRIRRKFYKGKERMYEVTTTTGKNIVCTQGHRLLTRDGWKSLSSLEVGDEIIAVEDQAGCGALPEGQVHGDTARVLAGQPARSDDVGRTLAARYRTPAALEDWEILRRFCTWPCGGRGRRGVAHKGRGDQSEGQGKVGSVAACGVHGISVHDEGSRSRRAGVCGEATRFHTDVIVSIEPVGVRDVWDIEVEDDHSYVAHGLVHHNSSSDPNLQNIPNKGGGKIKRAYVSRFGEDGVILQGDFSQIELRIAACVYGEPRMIDAYMAGDDLHTLTAVDIFSASTGKKPETYWKLPPEERKAWRVRAKRVNFLVLYGGGPPGLQTTLKKDGVFVTVDECQDLILAYFRKRPGLKRGIQKTERMVTRTGYLESFTGRLRRVPEVRSEDESLVARALRQSINFPIQSGASDMTMMAMCMIHARMQEAGYKSKMILTVHDSLVFDCHVDEVFEVACLAKQIMESLPDLSDEVLPGVDWKWLTVPVVAEFEIGSSWGTLVEFDPFIIAGVREPQTGDLYDADGKPQRLPNDVDELWELMAEKVA